MNVPNWLYGFAFWASLASGVVTIVAAILAIMGWLQNHKDARDGIITVAFCLLIMSMSVLFLWGLDLMNHSLLSGLFPKQLPDPILIPIGLPTMGPIPIPSTILPLPSPTPSIIP